MISQRLMIVIICDVRLIIVVSMKAIIMIGARLRRCRVVIQRIGWLVVNRLNVIEFEGNIAEGKFAHCFVVFEFWC